MTYTRKTLTDIVQKIMSFMTYVDVGMRQQAELIANLGERVEVLENKTGITAENKAIKEAVEIAVENKKTGTKPAKNKKEVKK